MRQSDLVTTISLERFLEGALGRQCVWNHLSLAA